MNFLELGGLLKNKFRMLKIIFFSDIKYEYQIEALIESILINSKEEVSLIYYTIGFNSSLDYPNLIKKFYDINIKKPRFEYYKPSILLDAIETFGKGDYLFLDSDIIIGHRFDILKIKNDYDFPLCPCGNWDYPFVATGDKFYENGKFVGKIDCDETNLMKYLGVEKRTMNYIYTCIISFNDRCIDIIKEWKSLCDDDNLIQNREFYYPFHDETPLNVILWKRGITLNFNRIFLNNLEFNPFKYIEENDNIIGDPNINYGIMSNNLMRCENSSNIMFYHGIKDKIELHKVISYLKKETNMDKFKNSEETKKQYIDVINNTEVVVREKPAVKIRFNQHFVGNPFFEILGNSKDDFQVEFWNGNKLYYSTTIKCNMWTKLNRKYFTEWTTKVYTKGKLIYENKLNLKNKRVFITLDSKSIGDSVAWMPFIEEFRKKHDCEVIASTFWNKLFGKSYPEIEFVEPGSVVNDLYAMYTIGCFYNQDLEPEPTNTLPLQKVITNILGLEYKEIKTKIDFKPIKSKYKNKYVVIAPHSTAGLKYWTEDGWQEVVDYLIVKGYKVINVSREGCDFNGVESIKNYSIENILNTIYHSEFMIGLSSGLPWLAWSLGKHVVMIANFTNSDHEFQENCSRITNTNVCHGCWNNPNFKFDKGDWWWCPVYKNTDKHFECHKTISSEIVISEINKLMS